MKMITLRIYICVSLFEKLRMNNRKIMNPVFTSSVCVRIERGWKLPCHLGCMCFSLWDSILFGNNMKSISQRWRNITAFFEIYVFMISKEIAYRNSYRTVVISNVFSTSFSIIFQEKKVFYSYFSKLSVKEVNFKMLLYKYANGQRTWTWKGKFINILQVSIFYALLFF